MLAILGVFSALVDSYDFFEKFHLGEFCKAEKIGTKIFELISFAVILVLLLLVVRRSLLINIKDWWRKRRDKREMAKKTEITEITEKEEQ